MRGLILTSIISLVGQSALSAENTKKSSYYSRIQVAVAVATIALVAGAEDGLSTSPRATSGDISTTCFDESYNPITSYFRHGESKANEDCEVGGEIEATNDKLSDKGREQAIDMGQQYASEVIKYMQEEEISTSKHVIIYGLTSEFIRAKETFKHARRSCEASLLEAGYSNISFGGVKSHELLNEQDLRELHGWGAGYNFYGIKSCLTSNVFAAALDCGPISWIKAFFGNKCESSERLECPRELNKRAFKANNYIQREVNEFSQKYQGTIVLPMVVAHENLFRAMSKADNFEANMQCGGTGSASKQGKIFASNCVRTKSKKKARQDKTRQKHRHIDKELG